MSLPIARLLVKRFAVDNVSTFLSPIIKIVSFVIKLNENNCYRLLEVGANRYTPQYINTYILLHYIVLS